MNAWDGLTGRARAGLSMTPRQAYLLPHVARWVVSLVAADLDHVPPGLGPRFISARRAAALVPDGVVVISSGMAAHGRVSLLYQAIRDRYAAQHHPRDLTWVAVGAVGSRGWLQGTLEECAAPGLVTTFISGHVETVKALLTGADRGEREVHTLPQGEMAFLIEGQARGQFDRVSAVGVGSFLDPRVGCGSAVVPGSALQLVSVADEERLRYRLPPLDVALLSAPYADSAGNIYARDAACLTEIHDAAHAVHANGGLVVVTVADVIEPRAEETAYVPAGVVDHIVVHPGNEQTASVPQRRAWPMFTVGKPVDADRALADLRLINGTLGITPRRGAADALLARLAAAVVCESVEPGAVTNIGVGQPELVATVLHETGLDADLIQTSEAGVWGGIPASGVFFGAAVNPVRQESSAWMFHTYEERLDVAVLGMLEVDSGGDVNLSRRGPVPSTYVGCGGAPNIAHVARTVVFVGSFVHGARVRVRDGSVRVSGGGEAKFVDAVREASINGRRALGRGQNLWYATHLGLFRLTERGLELVRVMPGVDIGWDLVARSTARIVLPPGGAAAVPLVPGTIVTGEGFTLAVGARPLGLAADAAGRNLG